VADFDLNQYVIPIALGAMGFMYWLTTYRAGKKGTITGSTQYTEQLALQVKKVADDTANLKTSLDAKVADRVKETMELFVTDKITVVDTKVDSMEKLNQSMISNILDRMTSTAQTQLDITRQQQKQIDKLEEKKEDKD
jgi:hypothetical protein